MTIPPEASPPPPATPSSAPGVLSPQDAQALSLLSIFYYVFAGLTALGGCCGLAYVVFGVVFAVSPESFESSGQNGAPPQALGWVFSAMGAILIAICLAGAALQFYAGRFISRRRHRVFCLVVAALNCLSIPLGTILGIFTIIVLSRPSVVRAFEASRPSG